MYNIAGSGTRVNKPPEPAHTQHKTTLSFEAKRSML
jgi:hypothetical protein